jgi:hypothetical protein
MIGFGDEGTTYTSPLQNYLYDQLGSADASILSPLALWMGVSCRKKCDATSQESGIENVRFASRSAVKSEIRNV